MARIPSASSASSEDEVIEPSHPSLSTLRCKLAHPPDAREPRYTDDELSRKHLLKRQRGCRCCVECGFWKHSLGFVRSLVKTGSPSFELRTFRTCNVCSRFRKELDEVEHFELYGAVDYNP